MKIASWNVNSLRVRLPQLATWMDGDPADVVGLQELKLPDEDFPAEDIGGLGLQAAWYGQKTYNGVALLSRLPLSEVVKGIPGHEDPQKRVIAATIAGVRVINVYVPNGQSVGSEKYAYKLDWIGHLQRYVEEALQRWERVVLMGDFNIAPDDRDVHDPAKWAGSVHVSEAERGALSGLMGLGLVDTFRLFDQPEGAYSWWDYRMGAFRRNHGLRIDLVLASQALAQRCTECRIDRAPRAWERPSDHAPVVATFDIA